MYTLKELDKKTYENFTKNHKTKSHFLQSYAWGEFSKAKKNLRPYYLGLLNNNEVVATTLLLEKKLPMGYKYYYAPRGFVLDYQNENIFKEMTRQIVKFVKSKKGIFIKIDPDIIYKSYNYLDKENNIPYNGEKILQMIKSTGFKHLGFTKNFETMQPRYTFRIDLKQQLEEIENHFSKTTKQRISKSLKLETEVKIGTIDDIHTFYHLMTLTEERKDFVSYTEDYYKKLYEIFNKDNKMTLFLGSVNIEKVLNNLEKHLEDIEKELSNIPTENLSKSAKNKLKEFTRQKEIVLKDIEKYQKYMKEYGKSLILNAHMIIEYGNKAWVLYAGNHNILTESYANYHTYYEHLKYCKEKGIEIYDQFGTIGDLKKDNPRLGLHEFKKKFGGDYVEFIGEFDYITNKLMYFVFTKLVPFYRKIIRNKSRKEIKNEVNRNK
ncbi:MAG: peptidoglycan bridge formation glycyltransferase FemA/FemB family protein [Bacilli bacterium]|nr:peptidoglycan bridge formation glycyltransferase FemA/FemB family protein [Bacilli bacterium]